MQRFAGQVAVVTGAFGGIGRAVATRLAEQGAAVVLADVNPAAARAAESIAASGAMAAFEQVDLADDAARDRLVPRVLEAWKRVDILVNNAANLGSRVGAADLDRGEWARVIDTNLTAAAFLSKDAAADMARREAGAIINITSIQEELPIAAHVPYIASKGGLTALTRALAVELSPSGIRVNAVAPGVVDTPAMAEERRNAGTTPEFDETCPTLLGRPGSPEEVADAVAFMASAEASFITGTTLRADGGRSLSRRPDTLASGFELGASTETETAEFGGSH